VTNALLLALPGGDEDDPDPALVLSQRPTAAQLTEAATVLGLFPSGSYLAGDLSLSLTV
jgi:hypothetical protein